MSASRPEPTGLIDLAAKRLGGMVVAANDEFFAAKENLLDPLPPVFDPLAYGDRGKVMDGWETRRRRTPGSDHCTVRLGVTGIVHAVVVDTSFFRGNFPQAFELHGTTTDEEIPAEDARWVPLIGRTELRGDAVQRFDLTRRVLATHVRLTIHPDGGVARLRLLGHPLVDLHAAADPEGRLDLAALVNGGRAVACSDAFFSAPANMIGVGDGRDMGDGWETRRRRGPGQDWAVLQLATTGLVERLEVDTTHFKGNYPDRVAVQAIDDPDLRIDEEGVEAHGWTTTPDGWQADGWTTLLPPTPMRPHARHSFDVPPTTATHLRVVMLPDGGISRVRAHGQITEEGWRRAGLADLHAMPIEQAEQALLACCGSTRWAREVAARRPFTDPGDLQATARDVWEGLDPADHLEAFAAHPRIGERAAAHGTSAAWSAREQAQIGDEAATARALAEGNAAYEQRFGHVFLIRAAGRSADEVLAALQQRMGNDPEAERQVAAGQQAEITALRIDRMLREGRST